MRRTYKSVSVEPRDGKHVVLLDSAPALTPGKNPLELPTLALAKAIAEEWRIQEKTVEPIRMPLTRYVNTAIDRTDRSARLELLMNYANTELLAYRGGEEALTECQRREWDPVLAWARDRYGIEYVLSSVLVPVDQPQRLLETLRAEIDAFDPFALTALGAVAEITGSLILTLALFEKRLEPRDAIALSRLDERYQAERWGGDPAAEKRAESMAQELEIVAQFLTLTGRRARA